MSNPTQCQHSMVTDLCGLCIRDEQIARLEQQSAELTFQNSQQGGKIESLQNLVLRLQAGNEDLQRKLTFCLTILDECEVFIKDRAHQFNARNLIVGIEKAKAVQS